MVVVVIIIIFVVIVFIINAVSVVAIAVARVVVGGCAARASVAFELRCSTKLRWLFSLVAATLASAWRPVAKMRIRMRMRM